jgi:hypothetical protein
MECQIGKIRGWPLVEVVVVDLEQIAAHSLQRRYLMVIRILNFAPEPLRGSLQIDEMLKLYVYFLELSQE